MIGSIRHFLSAKSFSPVVIGPKPTRIFRVNRVDFLTWIIQKRSTRKKGRRKLLRYRFTKRRGFFIGSPRRVREAEVDGAQERIGSRTSAGHFALSASGKKDPEQISLKL